MLIHNHQLSAQQLSDLGDLCSRCKKSDGHTIAVYKQLLKNNRPISYNLLYYEHQQLVGFLSTFFFYEDACEIAVMVDPAYRRRGIATQLLRDIVSHLYAQRIRSLIFSVPSGIKPHGLVARGGYFLRCEYQMQRQGGKKLPIANSPLCIRAAVDLDEAVLFAIDSACFPAEQSIHPPRFSELMQDNNYKIFVAELNNIPLGKAHLHLEAGAARLSDIAILPPYQGQGLGSHLLAYCINYLLSKNQSVIMLDVETNNQQALKLYLRLGFLVTNACDFWTIPLEVLRLTKH